MCTSACSSEMDFFFKRTKAEEAAEPETVRNSWMTGSSWMTQIVDVVTVEWNKSERKKKGSTVLYCQCT
jgi:hypothetical protein